MEKILNRAIVEEKLEIEEEAKEYLITSSGGDARAMLNLLNFAIKIDNIVTFETLKGLRTNAIRNNFVQHTLYEVIRVPLFQLHHQQ